MASISRKCRWCEKEGEVSVCQQCKLVNYCDRECQAEDWKAGHKILCSRVPKAVKKAKEKIESFDLSSYTTHNVGTFMATAAEARRGQIMEEHEAQDLCWNAMEMEKGSTEKLLGILRALDRFPLSTEAWGMLGHFYQFEVTSHDAMKKKCSIAALKMYDNAIICARKLNPTWTEDRSEELPWGQIENRPYLRSLHERSLALKNSGKRNEAIAQAKQIIRLNPNDNQGIRQILCTWFLEARDTEGCTNLLRKYGTNGETSLSYTDVLLQYLRWKKDDAVENEVKLALYVALKANAFVPDLLGVEGIEDETYPHYSPGGLKDAKLYVIESQKLWGKYDDAVDWIKSQKYDGAKVPSEVDLVDLLKSGTKFQMTCTHTNLDGNDLEESILFATQKRNRCHGCALADFHWPRRLNRPHESSSDILMHSNFDKKGWRKTKYADIKEVPYWRVFLRFYEEDADTNDDAREELVSSLQSQQNQHARYEATDASSLKCKECNSPGRFCALDNDCTEFYCSKSCMENFLEESEPTFFDLQSTTLKVHALGDCSIRTVSLNDAFRVAGDHMPNLNSVDIFINQDYLLKDNYSLDEDSRNILLSPNALKHFLEKMRTKLVSFSFRLDDCCWEEFKKMSSKCRSLLCLGTMPNLKKLDLTNLGFDDVGTLITCLSTGLQDLNLDYVKMGATLEWSTSEMDALVNKLSQLTSLVSLSLADSALTDSHLKALLPSLHSIRCLTVSGRFGGAPTDDPQLTDLGLTAIADNCPNILSLDVTDQKKVTITGIRALLRKCPAIVDFEAGGVSIGPQHLAEILCTLKKLLFFRFGSMGFRPPAPQEQLAIQNAVQATKGRVVVVTMGSGRVPINLSPEHKRNQDESLAKVERAHEQQDNPMVCNKWDGIL